MDMNEKKFTESEFKAKLSEYQMLSNTIVEMYEKNTPDEIMDDLRRDASLKLKEISEMRKSLDGSGDVEYETYEEARTSEVSRLNKFKVNDFSVDLLDIGIRQDAVKSVYYTDYRDDGDDKLSLVIYDHLVDDETPLMKRLTEVKDENKKFNVMVSHSKNDGYVEIYYDAYISKIYRGDLYEDANDFVTVTIEIAYDKVIYETAK